MKPRRIIMPGAPFSEEIKQKCLLWSDRHCCLCGKICGTDIEIAHISEPEDNTLDNAIPLCYDCHAAIGHYNVEHPRGNRYRSAELKARREQIYERHTSHLVPPLNIQLGPIGNENEDPDRPRVSTLITHRSNSNPIQLKLIIRAFVGSDDKGLVASNFYNGRILWNLTPMLVVSGGFVVPNDWVTSIETNTRDRLRFEINHTIIDIYEREHPQLPFCFSYSPTLHRWIYEPTSYEQISQFWRE